MVVEAQLVDEIANGSYECRHLNSNLGCWPCMSRLERSYIQMKELVWDVGMNRQARGSGSTVTRARRHRLYVEQWGCLFFNTWACSAQQRASDWVGKSGDRNQSICKVFFLRDTLFLKPHQHLREEFFHLLHLCH
jgi:hypothetical protein